MSTKYCDHYAYGAYSATPTWGQAQDGDGTAIGVATPSTADIVFTGVPSSGLIYVLGVVVSPAWATSADVCADNLATAINALTTTAVGPASFVVKSQVRNHVYARGPSTGAPAGTCQIMTRQASASHEGLVAFTHTLNNVSSAATVNFVGGTGGCWGWLFNMGYTLWPSAFTYMTYGIWTATKTFTGSMAAGDIVYIRSGKTMNGSGNNIYSIVLPAVGEVANPVVFDIDDSTVWSDGSNPVLRIIHTPVSHGYGMTMGASAGSNTHLRAKKYTDGTRNLSLEVVTTSGLSGFLSVGAGANTTYENLLITAPGTRSQSSMKASLGHSTQSMNGNIVSRFKGCKVVWPGQQSVLIEARSDGYHYRAEVIDCEFVATDAASAASSVVAIHSSSYHRLTLDSCKFTGFVSGSRLIASGTTTTGECALFIKNCDLGNINVLGPNMMSSVVGEYDTGMRGFFMTSQYGNHDFIYERAGRLYVEWLAAKGRPTLNAKLHDGVTPWSIFAVPSNTAGALGPVSPVELPRITKVVPATADLAEGVRTFTVNFLLESNLSWTAREVSVRVDYQAADGSICAYDSYDPTAGSLDSSTAAWSATSWNSQTWVKKQFSITTPVSVKAGSEVGIYVSLHTTSANDTWGIILDPEVIIT